MERRTTITLPRRRARGRSSTVERDAAVGGEQEGGVPTTPIGDDGGVVMEGGTPLIDDGASLGGGTPTSCVRETMAVWNWDAVR